LFNIFLEAIIAMTLVGLVTGAVIGGEMMVDLRIADDIALLYEEVADIQVLVSNVVYTSLECV